MIYEYLFPHLAAQKDPLEKEYWGGYKYKPAVMSDQDFIDTVAAWKKQQSSRGGKQQSSRGGRRMSRRRKQRVRRSRRASSRSRRGGAIVRK